jgi:hypothetical protein
VKIAFFVILPMECTIQHHPLLSSSAQWKLSPYSSS